ncbi:PREDICTED: uncharacterized protein LOC109114016 [Nelumbo nucifera]|uniref:Uncharacterized protein LOC109114016 n=1 Tax=Nelumbo nucifera TaxID=4432 RepID=A0A1U8PYD8_NELNU|nr:PREDICTED: uncharacterized protein LOC109114016 [Nelumbo nucifera]
MPSTRSSTMENRVDNMEGEMQRISADVKEIKESFASLLERLAQAPPAPIQEERSDTSHRSGSKTARIEFPIFAGGDPTSWLLRTERYFDYHDTQGPDRVPLASAHLEGGAIVWYQWYRRRHPRATWANFTDALTMRFGVSAFSLVQIQSPQFEMRSNSPLVANGYPLRGEIVFKKQKDSAPTLARTD